MNDCLTTDGFRGVCDVFALSGDDMRVHKGRSVVMVTVDGKTHFLKRFWFSPSQLFKRHLARGFHEMRMIDWLNDNGFAGPQIVRRGWSGVGPVCLKLFFLMEEVPHELPLEAAWRRYPDERDKMMADLASFTARLHDTGFVHTDFSERHILLGHRPENWTFRLIDLERAKTEQTADTKVANDLATLAASVMDEKLRDYIRGAFLDGYILRRTSLNSGTDFRALFAKATPKKSFH